MMLLEIRHLSKSFDGVKSVIDLSLSINEGTITSIVGPNGAGKTTLFNLITGFLQQDEGSIVYNGRPVDKFSAPQRALLGFGRIWQDVRVFNKMTVLENLLVARKNHPGEKIVNCLLRPRMVARVERETRATAEKILKSIKLDHKRYSLAQDLSYGQQKLLALGRLLVNDAQLLLVDEPTAGVNPVMVDEILAIMRDLTNTGVTVLMIEHNVLKARSISDHIYTMSEGRIQSSVPLPKPHQAEIPTEAFSTL